MQTPWHRTVPSALSVKMHVGTVPEGREPSGNPAKTRDQMASGISKAVQHPHAGQTPVAAGVPAGPSEMTEPAFWRYIKGECKYRRIG